MYGVDPESALVAAAKNPYWREHDAAVVLSAWSDSGLTVHAFARKYGISVSRLTRWRRRLGDLPVPAFHPVQVLVGAQDGRASLELVLKNGRRVVIRPGFDPDTLERLVQVVESWSC